MAPRAKRGAVLDWTRDEVYAGIEAARREVFLVSPYISAEIAREVVLRAAASRARRFRLLTCLSPAATSSGVLDPDALLEFLDNGWTLRSGRDLHAKATLVDRGWGVIGSGNLTVCGLGGESTPANAELGVVLGKNQVAEAERVLARWWKRAKAVDAAAVARCPKPARRRGGGRSGALGPNLGRRKNGGPNPDRARLKSTGLWLKMVYDRDEARGPQWWVSHRWVSDSHTIRADGKVVGRPTYAVDDLLVLYVVGRACPAVMRVTRTAEYEPRRVRRDPGSRPDDWRRWGWVTEVEPVHSVALAKAPKLAQIDVKASSVGQHSHIKLLPEQFALARRAILGLG